MAHDNLPGLPPAHPGETLREDVLPALDVPMATLAERLGVSRQTLYEVINERRAMTADLALRLSRVVGGSARSWMNLQADYDLTVRERALADELEAMTPIAAGHGMEDESTSPRPRS